MNNTILLRRLCVVAGTALLSAVLLKADEASSRTIRLNHYSARWDKVLAELAEASGKKLVAERVPAERFSRRDRSAYSLPEAVRILNSDLEPLGFRLLDMGEHLVVLDLPAARAGYRRPILRAADQPPSDHPPTPPEQSVTRKYQWNAESVVPASKLPRPNHSRDVNRPAGETIQQAGYSDHDEAAAERDGGAAHEEPTQLIVHVRRQPAADVGRKLYQAFRPRAELIDHGPRGLPAFRVFQEPLDPTGTKSGSASDSSDQRPSVRFTIGLDAAANDVLIEASKSQTQALAQVIERMDLAALEQGTSIQLLSTTKDAGEVARRLKRPLAGLFAQNTRGNNGEARDAGPPNRTDAENDRNGQPQAEKTPPVGTPKSDLPALIGGLKGEVTVESMSDLGLLILRGNEQDVEAVMQVIRQIEQLSVRTAPDMHLRFLKHADGLALTELLTSVYEKLGAASGRPAAQTKTVAVVAVVKPNAILVLAPTGEMESILDLVDKLDHPVDPLAEFAVFNLKHAVASQVVTMLETFFAERGGLGTRVRVIADVRTNAVVVQAQPRDLQEVTALVRKVDQNRSGAVNQIKFFSLKHAIAEDLVNVVNQAIQSVLNPPATPQGQGQLAGQVGTGQSSEQLREAKSAILQFLTGDGETKRVVRSGILADIRVTADPRMNSLVVTAPEQSMELMAEVIKQLDMPSSMVAEIKHFTLSNADATSVAQLLEELFGQQGQQGQRNQQGQQAGFQVAGAEDASSSVIPLRFSVDARTNSIIAIGGAESLQVVEALLLRLDASDIRQRQDTVYRLKNSPAADVANAINQFLSSQRQVEQADPNLVSPFEQMEREVVVVPELVSNSLLISATPRYFDAILELITKLDAAPSQVNIQALLVEVALDNTDEFGVEIGFQDSVLFNRSLINPDTFLTVTETMSTPATGISTTTQRVVSQEGSPGFLFNQSLLGNNVGANASHPAKVGTQGLSNFQLGRVNGDLGFGGLVLSAGSESVNVLLRALAATRRVDVLSRPLIRAVDNQLAQIQVGQEVPRVNGFQVNQATGAANPLVEQAQAGIILTVTPRITPEGQIVMEVVAEKSQFSSEGVALFTDASTGNVIESPIKDITTARTTVSVANNQTIVLGGMITKTDETIHRKVPWLGDVPILGKAFRYDAHTSRRTELLIFLTPRIIRTDADSEMIKQIETERIHFTEQDAEEIHGPIFAVPADLEPQEMAPPEPLEQAPAAAPLPESTFSESEKSDRSMTLAPPEISPLELFSEEKFSGRQRVTESTVKRSGTR